MVARLSASDATFYHLENSSTPMYVGSLAILRKPRAGLSYETLLATVEQRLPPAVQRDDQHDAERRRPDRGVLPDRDQEDRIELGLGVDAEAELEAADAAKRAGRCPDFGGEVGQGADVVAEGGRDVGELGAGQLHAVAAVAAEANDDGIELLDVLTVALLGGGYINGAHSVKLL